MTTHCVRDMACGQMLCATVCGLVLSDHILPAVHQTGMLNIVVLYS